VADITDELIRLGRFAAQERAKLAGLDAEEYAAQWRRWSDADEEFQAAVTAQAEATGQARHEIEMATKKAMRHTQEDPVE
jgi:hypothetical protein